MKLREIEETDLDLIVKWRNNPIVRNGLTDLTPISKIKEHQWYENYINDTTWQMYIIRIKSKSIGIIGFKNISYKNQTAELSVYIGEDSWRGKGYASKALNRVLNIAFNEMNIRKIKAITCETNTSAITLYKKFSFQIEGVLHDEIFKNGQFQDMLIMSLFRDDWNER